MGKCLSEKVDGLITDQLANWPLAMSNYGALGRVLVKTVVVDGIDVRVQFNPERIISSSAKVDAQSISERPCFLCPKNLPEQQNTLPWKNDYQILVNPFPIFTKHLTIPSIAHTPQTISGRIVDMLQLAADLPQFTVFYNGAQCGASAPDHFHFQAGLKGVMPIEQHFESGRHTKLVSRKGGCNVFAWPNYTVGVASFVGDNYQAVANAFELLYGHLQTMSSSTNEPMLNILAQFNNGQYVLYLFPRIKHRPSHYFLEENNVMMSPASVDMGGLWVTPRREDYERMDAVLISEIASEVCLSPSYLVTMLHDLFHQ